MTDGTGGEDSGTEAAAPGVTPPVQVGPDVGPSPADHGAPAAHGAPADHGAPAAHDAGAGEHTGPGGHARHQGREFPTALLTLVVVAVVVVVVIVLVVVKLTSPGTATASTPPPPVPKSVLQTLYSIPRPVFDAAGGPGEPQLTLPTVLHDQPRLRAGGRPELVWVGAEFCPTCAAERWAVVVALSRFGRFTGLTSTWSAWGSPIPHLPTFSFEGATYASRFVSLAAVEEYGDAVSDRAPGGYPALGEPTGAERALQARLAGDVPSAVDGTLPFVDVANRLVVVGSTFPPGLLSGLTVEEVATDLAQSVGCTASTGTSLCEVAGAVLGSANELDAGLCAAGARDRRVCSSPAVRQADRTLGIG